ncbi:TIGR00266 family protein [Candidatus Micrarchaeota archaeon]|nr:TIGR00266 family protein [Candidatus Micrarchaeota archaeon]MBD3418362.1 TIGR00266 family protein [Candidatus Micrarchaeota archaeon]
MEYRMEGTVMPLLHIFLDEGESVISERGAMIWMDDNIDMHTGSHGGIGGGVHRMLMGESFFINKFTAKGGPGSVSFGLSAPGKIMDFKISEGKELICQKDAFLAATGGIKLDSYVKKKLMVGFVGGEGFVLQKLSGDGHAFLEIDGEVYKKHLEAGETIYVETGSIAAFDRTVSYDVQRLKGVRNVLFGGEGFWLSKLTGPGEVYLQTMSMSLLAERLLPFLPIKKK